MSGTESWGRPKQTLTGLLALVGERFVELGGTPQETGGTVSRVVLLDPLEPQELPGDLLVAVGVDPHSEEAVALVRRAGAAGAAGVVFGPAGTGPRNEALREAAAEAGTAVLFRGWWTDWPTAIGMLHAGLSVAREPGIAACPAGRSGGAGEGDRGPGRRVGDDRGPGLQRARLLAHRPRGGPRPAGDHPGPETAGGTPGRHGAGRLLPPALEVDRRALPQGAGEAPSV